MRVALTLILIIAGGLASNAQARQLTTRVLLAPARPDLSAKVRMEGFAIDHTPGQPPLPVREVAVALHPAADLATLALSVRSGPVDSLPGEHELKPNPPYRIMIPGKPVRLHWGRAGTVLAGRDLDAFGSRVFPAKVVTVSSRRVTNRRGLLVLHLRYTPLRYRHSQRELLLDRHTEVKVSYRLRPGVAHRPDPQLAPWLERVHNTAQARLWYGDPRTLLSGAAPVGYAIVIPDALANKSKQLQAFVQHKESLGMKVTTVGDAELAKINVGPAGGDAERIRGWLQQSYKQLNLKYVLLVGNPDPGRDGVPMKMAHTMAGESHYSATNPTDDYYAELTGNWDLDGDGNVAEYPEDKGEGGIDFEPEVYVGRIPVYGDNVAVLDRILKKTIAYATATGDKSWRGRVLQPASIYWYKNENNDPGYYRVDGATVADIIRKEVIEPRGFEHTGLYEKAGDDPSKLESELALTPEELIKEWQRGYGLVLWYGHGSAGAVYRKVWKDNNGDGIPGHGEVIAPAFFSYDDVIQLDDSRPSFVFAGATCMNATPERSDNVVYGLLRHGAVGAIGNTRVSFVSFMNLTSVWSTGFGIARDFTDQMLQGKSVGEAVFIAKSKVSDSIGDLAWYTRLELALYGDPSLTLAACTEDPDCDDGSRCSGVETCKAGQCVAGKPVPCESADPCTDAVCDEESGECVISPRPEGERCEDGKFCTVNETCQQGECLGEPRCAAPHNPCVASECDEAAQTCDVQPVKQGQLCHKGTDREGACLAGICEPNDTGGCAVALPPGWSALPGAGALLALALALALGLVLRRRSIR